MRRHTLRSTLALAALAALAAGNAVAADTAAPAPTGSHIRQEAQRMDTIQVRGAMQSERSAPLNAREATRPAKPDLPTIDATQWTAQTQTGADQKSD